MEPIRILHENVIMDAGGIETQLMRIYRNIDRTKIQFDFLVHRREKGVYDDEIISLGGKIYYVEPFNPFHHIKYVKSMDAFFKEHPEYKIFIVHSELSLWPLKVAKKHELPIRICYSHNGRSNFCLKRIFMDLEKIFIKRYCNIMFAVSKLAATYTFGKKAVKENKVKIIKNGVMVEEYRFNQKIRELKRKELNLNDKLIIGHIGRFMVQKNHMFLLDIFNEIIKIRKDAHLILVGEGRLQEEIETKIEKMNLNSNVTFLGIRKDVNELMMAMDLMILPSLYEGFPNVAIEAQASSLPIYISNTITKEALFTSYCKQIDLNLSALEWARIIIEDIDNNYKRCDMVNIIKEKGHSILDTVKWYEEFYLNNSAK